MDVHKDSISIGILRPDDSMDVEKIFHDEESVRRFIARMGDARQLSACYEAGPTASGLERLLKRLQVRCDVVAPSLIPKAPGDRVKDRPQGSYNRVAVSRSTPLRRVVASPLARPPPGCAGSCGDLRPGPPLTGEPLPPGPPILSGCGHSSRPPPLR
jgi:transposase